MQATDILSFWFEELAPEQWFVADPKLDQTITERFLNCHLAAIKGELYTWRETAEGALAEIISIDQFSRNIFRNKPEAFLHDGTALVLAQTAIEKSQDQQLAVNQRAFMYLPFMHSESKAIHQVALELFSQAGLEYNYKYELEHKAEIDKFGRYPHRNVILGRESTPEELEYLKNK